MKRQVPLITDGQGSVAVMTVVLMFVIVGLLAFIIDLAHVKTVKTELQNAADASALAGARAFLRYDLRPTGLHEEDPDPANARTQAYNAIAENRSDNVSFQVGDLAMEDIQVGIWDYVNRRLLPWQWPPDASMWGLQIGPAVSLPMPAESDTGVGAVRRTDAVSLGAVGSERLPHARMLLARLFGFSSIAVHTGATAALSAVGGFTEAGCPDFPICITQALVEAGAGEIVFHADGEDTGGWTNLRPIEENDHTDANDIKNYFRNCGGCGNLDPQGSRTVSVNNGTMCSATGVLIKEGGACFDPPLNLVEDDDPNTKNTMIPLRFKSPFSRENPNPAIPDPVYIFATCQWAKLNQWHTVGATCARILQVSSAPDDCALVIQIVPDCNKTLGGSYGTGNWYGVLSAEPKLVR